MINHLCFVNHHKLWTKQDVLHMSYLCDSAQIKVTQSTKDHKEPQVINTLQKGDYFGEKALIR